MRQREKTFETKRAVAQVARTSRAAILTVEAARASREAEKRQQLGETDRQAKTHPWPCGAR